MNDDEMTDIMTDVYRYVDSKITDKNLYAIAAALLTTALMIYKSTMTEKDYEMMCESVYKNRYNVKPSTTIVNNSNKMLN